jgi:hypothetical protein
MSSVGVVRAILRRSFEQVVTIRCCHVSVITGHPGTGDGREGGEDGCVGQHGFGGW